MNSFLEKLKIGNAVKIRDYSELEERYGIDDYFDICTTPKFEENMRKFCGEYFQVDHININSVFLSSIDDNKRTQDVEEYEFPMESLIW